MHYATHDYDKEISNFTGYFCTIMANFEHVIVNHMKHGGEAVLRKHLRGRLQTFEENQIKSYGEPSVK